MSVLWSTSDVRFWRLKSVPALKGLSHENNFPAGTRRWTNVGLLLGQRRRRWANIKPTLVQGPVPAGLIAMYKIHY